MPVRPRILILPISAAIIVSLVAFKLTRPPQVQQIGIFEERRPAPAFTALDSHNKLLKIDAFLGRHEILLVFFDGDAGADHDPVLQRIRLHFDRLKRRDVKVFAVSTALPQHNRQAADRGGAFPFPLLSDPEFLIHRRWGRYDDDQQRPLTGVFVIDRAGQVAWSGKSPRPEENLDRILPPAKEAQ
ncbi:MAG TPA: redoxin domain-containing protein [Planctomycetaceae bacterium]|nr:redoxin domain-containing protein [Planctomycetaceae bacterium]